MKNNFEKKFNRPHRHQTRFNRREFIKNLLIGFGIGTIIYLIKNLLAYKQIKDKVENESQLVSNLQKNIEIIKTEIANYLYRCDNYHNHLKQELNKIKKESTTINDINKYEHYIEKLEEYLKFLKIIDNNLTVLTKKIEGAIVKINNLNISKKSADDLTKNLLELVIQIKKTEKNNLELTEEILKFKISLQKEINLIKNRYLI